VRRTGLPKVSESTLAADGNRICLGHSILP
jgi:hypothetical protein